jgi:hypothetical protein
MPLWLIHVDKACAGVPGSTRHALLTCMCTVLTVSSILVEHVLVVLVVQVTGAWCPADCLHGIPGKSAEHVGQAMSFWNNQPFGT